MSSRPPLPKGPTTTSYLLDVARSAGLSEADIAALGGSEANLREMALYMDQVRAQQSSSSSSFSRPSPSPPLPSKTPSYPKRRAPPTFAPTQRVQTPAEQEEGAGEQMIAQMEWIRKRAAEQKTLGEERIIFQDPRALVEGLTQSREKALRDQKGMHILRTSIVGEERTFSNKDLKDLQRIDLFDTRVRKIHRGRYLLVRIATLPNLIHGFTSGIVDTAGYVILAAFYNFPFKPLAQGIPTPEELEAVFPIDTILAIKEPWIKMAAQGDSALLRIDSPTDVVVFKEGDELLEGIKWRNLDGRTEWKPRKSVMKSVDVWKTEGNKHFAAKRYIQAERAYSHGIDQHPSSSSTHLLHLNRAATLIHLERFSAALQDANKVIQLLQTSPTSPLPTSEPLVGCLQKAHHRRSSSLYSLRRWEAARLAFTQFLALFPSSTEASVGLARSEARLQEEKTGRYDVLSLYRSSLKSSNPRHDVADFVGPVQVSPRKKPSKGSRGGAGIVAGKPGLRTTRQVLAGEVLLASKALGIVYKADITKGYNLVSLNLFTNKPERGTQALLRSQLVSKFMDQPELASRISSLPAGPDAPPRSNSDTLGLKTSLSPPRLGEEVVPSVPIDYAALEAVSTFNAFGLTTIGPVADSSMNSDSTLSINDETSALFTQNSLINHSCFENATVTCFGDFQIIRALTSIPKGSEVFISYTTTQDVINHSYWKRQLRLQQFFGPSSPPCSCPLCISDLADGEDLLSRRERLMTEGNRISIPDRDKSLPSSMAKVRKTIKAREKVVEDLLKTYTKPASSDSPRPEMYNAYHQLGYAWGCLGERTGDDEAYEKSIQFSILALQALGMEIRRSEEDPSSSSSSQGSGEGGSVPTATATEEPSPFPLSSSPRTNFDHAILAIFQAAYAYLKMQRKDEEAARDWLKLALWVHGVTVGGGKELFLERCGRHLDAVGLREYV